MKLTFKQQSIKIKSLKKKIKNTRNNQQHKQDLLEELLDVLRINPESRSIPPSSNSTEKGKIKTTILLSSRQRKRARH